MDSKVSKGRVKEEKQRRGEGREWERNGRDKGGRMR